MLGRLDESLATEAELRGEQVFNGKGPLRGIKDSPPYLHDDRLLTLEDSVEFFNLVLGVQLTAAEKADLVAFLRTL